MIVMLLSGVRATENETLTSSNWEYGVNGENVYTMKYTGTEEDVVVPAVIDGKKVVSIGEDTFTDCKTLKNITLSENIKILKAIQGKHFLVLMDATTWKILLLMTITVNFPAKMEFYIAKTKK